MAWTWTAVVMVSVFVAYVLQLRKKKKNKSGRRLPPGPKQVPILGHFHLLGNSPHRDLHQLAQKHGPIMYMRFGFVPNIVVSSPDAAELFLKTHDLAFASRPPHEAAKYVSYEQRGLSFAPYGPYWRNMRKMCTLELLSSHKIASFQSTRLEELHLLIKLIKQAARDRIPVDLSAKVSNMTADMSCRMVFGKKYDQDKEFDERGFKAVIGEGMKLAAIPNLGDYFPYLGRLDLQGLTRRMKAISKVFDQFLEMIIEEHLQSPAGETRDFVDILLAFMESEQAEFRIDRCHVKAVMLDMLAGSMDTSATAIEWVLSDLIKHPQVMKKVQNELEKVVGRERMVEESDLEKLEYLDMVVKESFRLHPVAPLLLPHEAREDCIVNGYYIPKGARVTINVWAIGRDPNAWSDPHKFTPERFAGGGGDCSGGNTNLAFRGHDFQFLPFGAGRRSCPGMQLGLLMVRFVVAQLVHCFDWELPGNIAPSELDMTEEFGLVVTRANHLLAIPICRLLHK